MMQEVTCHKISFRLGSQSVAALEGRNLEDPRDGGGHGAYKWVRQPHD